MGALTLNSLDTSVSNEKIFVHRPPLALAGSSEVVATERHDEPIILDNLHRSIQLNREDLAAKAVHICVQPFSWDLLDGLIGGLTDETSEKGYDIILGSDLFYSGESFDPILAVVSNQDTF